MPPFQNARPHYKRRTLRIWNNQVRPDLRDPELLWGMDWERFNTVRIPVLEEDEYFERALEIAKGAKDREDFERSFRERNAKDWAELLDLMSDITRHTLYHHEDFPCDDAWLKTRKASQTGSLMDFVRLLKGVAFGWEADEVRETQIDESPSGEEAPIGADTTGQEEVFVEMEDLDWEEEQAMRGDYRESVIFHGTYTYFPTSEPASQAPDAALCANGDEPSIKKDAATSRTASTLEDDGSKETQRLQRKRKRLRFSDDIIQVPEPNQASSPRSADDGSVTGERQLPSDGNDRTSKRQKLDDSTAGSHTNPSCQHDQSIPKKRPIRDDDDDDDDDGNGEQRHKRHKANSFPRNHAEAETDTSRISKRPICDDDNEPHDHDDNDNDEHRHKRQRRAASSQQQEEANVNEPKVSSKQRSGRSRRKRSNANRASENIKTRSLNRVRPSTFWELDHTGKASIRI